jgi:hypothetical protein
LLWPTANANGGTGYLSGSNRDTWRPTLESAVQMCPTGQPPLIRKGLLPTLLQAGARQPGPSLTREGSQPLSVAVREMFPTLSAQEFGCKDVARMLERREECRAKRFNGNGFGLTLSQYLNVLPTLTARPGRSGKDLSCHYNSRPLSEVAGGLLNPTWCEWFMGFPAGWTESGVSATP